MGEIDSLQDCLKECINNACEAPHAVAGTQWGMMNGRCYWSGGMRWKPLHPFR